MRTTRTPDSIAQRLSSSGVGHVFSFAEESLPVEKLQAHPPVDILAVLRTAWTMAIPKAQE